jgi:Ser/Thr protein kinase RdoA (MazF antagonist)
MVSTLIQEVIRRFPALTGGSASFLGNHGGFSGAKLWRVDTESGPYCLRSWPGDIPETRIAWVHGWMKRAQALPFVPAVTACADGRTVVELAGRCWDATRWLSGAADDSTKPNASRVTAACVALAQLHRVWASASQPAPCPAILRRLERNASWLRRVKAGWRPRFQTDDPVRPVAERAWEILSRQVDRLPASLEPWAVRPVPIQPCLCDVWRPHVLFTGDAVTGLIDYGGMKLDNVAGDLARLLGSWVGEEPALIAAGLDAYTSLRPLSTVEQQLVPLLDQTGTLLGAANWLDWLYGDVPRVFDDRLAVAQRLAHLVARLERMAPTTHLHG